jgi:hypothetical protein
MKDILVAFGPITLMIAVFYAPVFLIYRVACSAKKNTSYVLIAGLLLGWLGAAVVAMICPRMSDEEFAVMHPPRVAKVRVVKERVVKARITKAPGKPMDIGTMILWGISVCALGLGGMMFFISRM